MGASYGQFCPVSKAVEVLDERWTLLVVRELLFGSTRFNEIRRGVPRIAQREGAVEFAGPTRLCRPLPSWFTLAPAAAVPRPAQVG